MECNQYKPRVHVSLDIVRVWKPRQHHLKWKVLLRRKGDNNANDEKKKRRNPDRNCPCCELRRPTTSLHMSTADRQTHARARTHTQTHIDTHTYAHILKHIQSHRPTHSWCIKYIRYPMCVFATLLCRTVCRFNLVNKVTSAVDSTEALQPTKYGP